MEKEKIILFLENLRFLILRSMIFIFIASFVSFLYSKKLIHTILNRINITVYYLSLSEAFFSSIEFSLFCGFFFSFPLILFLLFRKMKRLVTFSLAESFLFFFLSLFLFYSGALFCFMIVLPSGIKFLLSYGNPGVMPMISVKSFVTFFIAMIMAFSLTFEIPLFFLILGRMKLLKSSLLIRSRRYAILLITLFSAIITPTPDIYNMALLAIPMYVLFEFGILLLRIEEKRKIN